MSSRYDLDSQVYLGVQIKHFFVNVDNTYQYSRKLLELFMDFYKV